MKKLLIQLSPDPAPSSADTVSHKGYVAQAELDLLAEGKRVSTWWSTGTNAVTYPLVYITAPQFALKVTGYDNTLSARIAIGTTRPQQTKNLSDLDIEIEKALPQMRVDIGAKFGAANRFTMFPQFGFIHYRDRWIFPIDHDNRLESITLCKNACVTHGMTTIQYNDAWWTQMETDFAAALSATQTTDSSISGAVATKNPDRDLVDKVLHSLFHIIKGNHPDDYKQILRVAGFQKEDM
jgi:hypothetical protein